MPALASSSEGSSGTSEELGVELAALLLEEVEISRTDLGGCHGGIVSAHRLRLLVRKNGTVKLNHSILKARCSGIPPHQSTFRTAPMGVQPIGKPRRARAVRKNRRPGTVGPCECGAHASGSRREGKEGSDQRPSSCSASSEVSWANGFRNTPVAPGWSDASRAQGLLSSGLGSAVASGTESVSMSSESTTKRSSPSASKAGTGSPCSLRKGVPFLNMAPS